MKWLAVFTLIFGGAMAHADGGKFSVPDYPKWKEECGSCHIAYPPQLLTGDAWGRLMGGLDKHFGTNAILDPRDNKEILDFLQRYAGHKKIYSAPSLRITDTPWFDREHHEVPDEMWSDQAVRTRSNCAACHIKADSGDWSERGVKMPEGQRAGEREGKSGRDDYGR